MISIPAARSGKEAEVVIVKARLEALRVPIKGEKGFIFSPLDFVFLFSLATFIPFQVKSLFTKSIENDWEIV